MIKITKIIYKKDLYIIKSNYPEAVLLLFEGLFFPPSREFGFRVIDEAFDYLKVGMNTVIKEDAQRRELSFRVWNQSMRIACRRIVENVPNSWILRGKTNKGKFMYQIFSWIWYLLNILWRYKCPISYKWKVWWIICILESWFLSQKEDWDFLSLVCWKHDFMRSFLLIKRVEGTSVYLQNLKQTKQSITIPPDRRGLYWQIHL